MLVDINAVLLACSRFIELKQGSSDRLSLQNASNFFSGDRGRLGKELRHHLQVCMERSAG
jgi:hypothetical protein